MPGLKAGSYTMKVVPVIAGLESISAASTSSSVTVLANDRTGFAFSNGRVPGAYQMNGLPKSNAVIIYVTENTKNTISLDVTGASVNPCVGLQTILEGFKKGKDTRPLIVRMVGQITDLDYMLSGDIVVENNNNANSFITIEGVGDDAVADGWGIRIKNASNIEIHNIATMNCNSNEGDNIGLQQSNDYIWIHHCDFFYGDAGADADQAKGDGALDCKKSTYVTFSYNHFWDSGKSNLLGLSEGSNDGLFITYHHNWYDHSDSRHPRVRYYSAHVYNNYYDGNSKYGVGSTLSSSVFVEGNYFRNCKYPILTSMQGTDVYDESKQANDYSDMPTFSKEDGGSIKAYNNFMTGQRRFVPYGTSGYPNPTVDFDAYVVSSRNEAVPGNVVSASGGNTYNNFDTNNSMMYSYTADSPEAAKDKVIVYAGRIEGGDYKFIFNNAVDDISYDVNAALKADLVSYKTSIVAIQGDGEGNGSGGNGDGGTGGGNTGGIVGDLEHNFTVSGMVSSFLSISGNLSTSKGTVLYNGLTLTQCLKLESSTTISFTTLEETSLTLVLNDTFNGSVKIDGTSYSVSSGILTVTLAAGIHEILKGDSANLYYLSIKSTNPDTGTKTALTLTAQSFTIHYGDPIPDLAIDYAGFINGDDESDITIPTISTTATASSGVGIYDIILSGGSAANYNLTLVAGKLTITQATLTATTLNLIRNIGESNPDLTIEYSGFVLGETSAVIDNLPIATTDATEASPKGTYDILVSGGSDVNYAFEYVSGTLTVTGPEYTLPSSIEFGSVEVGKTSSHALSLTNTGDGSWNVTAINLPNGFIADESVFIIAPSDSKNINITFTPTTVSTNYSGQMEIVSNNGTEPISITGEGIEGTIGVLAMDNLDTRLRVYPNPTSSVIFVEAKEIIKSIEIMDLTGRKISLSLVNKLSFEMNVTDLKSGSYIIKIESESGNQIERIVVRP